MARAALYGVVMEKSDIRIWPRLKAALKFVLWELIIGWFVLVLCGFLHPVFRDAGWRDFMLAGGVTATALLLNARLMRLLDSSPTVIALYHLPVSGRDINRWALGETLRHSLALLPRMLVVAFAWQGFPALAAAWPQVLAVGVLLWLVMLACVMLNNEPLVLNLRVAHVWRVVLLTWLMLLLYAWWREKSLSHATSLPSWIPALCEPASWLLPTKWAMHGVLHESSAMLTLVCLGLGAWLWRRFPDKNAAVFDQTLEGFIQPGSDDGDDETWNESGAAPVTAPEVTDEIVTALGSVSEKISRIMARETSKACTGWIEKLTYASLRGRDRMLAPILIGYDPGWTTRWWLALRLCILLLVLGYTLFEFGTSWITPDAMEPWLWIAPLALLLGLGYPLSNSIPMAVESWPLGQHAMPCFAGLPIGVRELMRVSFRVTAVRTLGALTLALPVLAAQCFILKQPERIPALLVTAASLSACWIMARPAFIYYRLQQVSRPARSAVLSHWCWYLVLAPLALGLVFSFVLAIAMPLLPALGAGLCARCMYGIFHGRARSRKLDWVSD